MPFPLQVPRDATQIRRPHAPVACADGAAAGVRRALLAWFRGAARDLPWRRDRDPYRVWISEAMLQQTRVEAVVPYFERFVERFPTVRDLGEAPLDDVLAAWSGLGYYRRARALHAAARAVLARHAGRIPSTRAELLELPGIGPYTAGAIASIAFGEPEPLVDGNVARVLARLFAIDAPQASAAFRERTWAIAAALVPRQSAAGGQRARAAPDPGEWNQALMELGATVCVPREPRCPACPLRAHCAAALAGRADELPRAKARPAPIDVELLALVVRDSGRILLEQRPALGRMAGLWQLPTIETSGGALLHPHAFPSPARGRAQLIEGEPLFELRHAITRHRIRARVAEGRWLAGEPAPPFAWQRQALVADVALTGLARKVLRQLTGIPR